MIDEAGISAPDIDDSGVLTDTGALQQGERRSRNRLKPAHLVALFGRVHSLPVGFGVHRRRASSARGRRQHTPRLSPRVNCAWFLATFAVSRPGRLTAAAIALRVGHSSWPSAFCLLPSAFCLLPSAFCLLPSAFCLLPSAFYLLPSAFCLLPSAFCPLPSAFCLYLIEYL